MSELSLCRLSLSLHEILFIGIPQNQFLRIVRNFLAVNCSRLTHGDTYLHRLVYLLLVREFLVCLFVIIVLLSILCIAQLLNSDDRINSKKVLGILL